MGEQTMTEFEVKIYKNDKLVDTQKVKTGIRKIELVEEPDSIGCAMYFKVNGKKEDSLAEVHPTDHKAWRELTILEMDLKDKYEKL